MPTGSSCAYSVAPTSLQASPAGGTLTVSVQTAASCSWTISGLPSWITILGAAPGSAIVTLQFLGNCSATRNATILIAGASVAITQPGAACPFISSVANAASNLSGFMAPGEIVVLHGTGLGPPQLTAATVGSDGLYDTQLAGTTVSFNGTPAPIIYTWATQVAAVVPYEITSTTAIPGPYNGQVTIWVTYQGQSSATIEEFTTLIAPSMPDLFTSDSTGQGQAAAINNDGITVNTAATPAKVSDVISLFATGEGQTTPAGVDGKLATPPYPTPTSSISVTVGGAPAQVLYAGGVPGELAGLMQVNLRLACRFQVAFKPATPSQLYCRSSLHAFRPGTTRPLLCFCIQSGRSDNLCRTTL